MLVQPGEEVGAQLEPVEQKSQRRVQRRDQQRRRDALPRNVAQHQSPAAAAGKRKKVVIVATDVSCRAVPSGELVARNFGSPLGQNLPLDLGGELDLAFETFLFERLAMQVGILERDRRLIGQQIERAAIGRRERPYAAPALFVADHQNALRQAVDGDRHPEDVRRSRQNATGQARHAGEQLARLFRIRIESRLGIAPENAMQVEPARLLEVERTAPGVGQRDCAYQDLLAQTLEVERRCDGETDVIERLELDTSGFDFEVLAFQLAAQDELPRRGHEREEERWRRRTRVPGRAVPAHQAATERQLTGAVVRRRGKQFLVRRSGGCELAAIAALDFEVERRATRTGGAIQEPQKAFGELPALRFAPGEIEELVLQGGVRGGRCCAGHSASCVTAVVWSG